jgi:hypothetical protein
VRVQRARVQAIHHAVLVGVLHVLAHAASADLRQGVSWRCARRATHAGLGLLVVVGTLVLALVPLLLLVLLVLLPPPFLWLAFSAVVLELLVVFVHTLFEVSGLIGLFPLLALGELVFGVWPWPWVLLVCEGYVGRTCRCCFRGRRIA